VLCAKDYVLRRGSGFRTARLWVFTAWVKRRARQAFTSAGDIPD